MLFRAFIIHDNRRQRSVRGGMAYPPLFDFAEICAAWRDGSRADGAQRFGYPLQLYHAGRCADGSKRDETGIAFALCST